MTSAKKKGQDNSNNTANSEVRDALSNRLLLLLTVSFFFCILLLNIHGTFRETRYISNALQTSLLIIAGLLTATAVMFAILRRKTNGSNRVLTIPGVFVTVLIFDFAVFTIITLGVIVIPYFYVLILGICIVYLINHIYQRDYTYISLLCVFCGCGIWFLNRIELTNRFNGLYFPLSIAAILFFALSVVFTLSVMRGKGYFNFRGNKYKIFSHNTNYTLVLIISIILTIFIICNFILGSSYQYYIIGIVIAMELIFGIYYTLKLM